jgi:putative membrane protein insertion efficiency factor
MGSLAKVVAKGLIRGYQLVLSPLLGLFGTCCRFGPSCSEYAMEAVDRFGAGKGSWLAIKRLSRCHPWGGSGFDPVPTKDQS